MANNIYKILFFLSFVALSYQWSISGVPEPDERTTFTIALTQHNIELLKSVLLDISNPFSTNYGSFLSVEEIDRIVSPSKSEKEDLYEWVIENNLFCYDFGDAIRCVAEISDIEKALQVRMVYFTKDSETILRSINDYTIPDKIKSIVVFIEGISGFPPIPEVVPKVNVGSGPSVDHGIAAREVLLRLYDIPDNLTINASVAAIEFGDQSGFAQGDIIKSQNLNAEPSNKVDYTIGPNIMPDTETELDLQMMSQVSKGVGDKLWFIDTPQWMYTFAVDLLHRKTVPEVISMSWGWAEDQQCTIANCHGMTSQQYVERCNAEFVKVGLRGVTMLAASGDAGSPGRTSEGCDPTRPINPVFPGSSPWVLSVGASFVVANSSIALRNFTSPICESYQCITGTQQLPTNFNFTWWTSGSGFGFYNESTPSWQLDRVASYLANPDVKFPPKHLWNRNGRAYPDVTTIGHNCPVWMYSELQNVDGTSCSSPVMAGIISLINDHQKSRGKPVVGFVNPLIYQLADSFPDTFTDIETGYSGATEGGSCPMNPDGSSDFGFFGAKGFDAVTGLGTPNFNAMINGIDLLVR